MCQHNLGNMALNSDQEDNNGKTNIREELRSMSFEELIKLKEKLGAKVYKEAVYGIESDGSTRRKKQTSDFKRLNKNRPREQSSKKQVPFLGNERSTAINQQVRDPRFDEESGRYDVKKFKHNYEFLIDVRNKDIEALKKKLMNTDDDNEAASIKHEMQRLKNKNIEEKNWHMKQAILEEEKTEIKKARDAGQKPHYTTKKERRTKELVKKFEDLKQSGSLAKHLEKRRKKNAAKDRKKFSFD